MISKKIKIMATAVLLSIILTPCINAAMLKETTIKNIDTPKIEEEKISRYGLAIIRGKTVSTSGFYIGPVSNMKIKTTFPLFNLEIPISCRSRSDGRFTLILIRNIEYRITAIKFYYDNFNNLVGIRKGEVTIFLDELVENVVIDTEYIFSCKN